jgi:hypothetical protein
MNQTVKIILTILLLPLAPVIILAFALFCAMLLIYAILGQVFPERSACPGIEVKSQCDEPRDEPTATQPAPSIQNIYRTASDMLGPVETDMVRQIEELGFWYSQNELEQLRADLRMLISTRSMLDARGERMFCATYR